MWGWLGGTVGAFIFGGICAGLGYLAFDIINERRLKRKQPDDIYAPELLNGKKEIIDERGREEHERRKRIKSRVYEKLRNIAGRIGKGASTVKRAISRTREDSNNTANSPSVSERSLLQDDVSGINQGEYPDTTSWNERGQEPDI